jgi:hypothetical protein
MNEEGWPVESAKGRFIPPRMGISEEEEATASPVVVDGGLSPSFFSSSRSCALVWEVRAILFPR